MQVRDLIVICSITLLAAVPALAQDAAAGKAAYAQCAACHSIDGNNGVGPSLKGVADRKAGTFPGFRYSPAMKSATISWDEKTLDAFLAAPQKIVPGNTMPFPAIPNAKLRADLAAYLLTLR